MKDENKMLPAVRDWSGAHLLGCYYSLQEALCANPSTAYARSEAHAYIPALKRLMVINNRLPLAK